MKRIVLPLLVLAAGLSVGGGAAYAVTRIIAMPAGSATPVPTAAETNFVPVSKILAPLVTADGRLSGYVTFEVALEVPAERAADITAALPMLRHGINLQTYRTPMAAGPDGMLPDLNAFRTVVVKAAEEAFGAHVV